MEGQPLPSGGAGTGHTGTAKRVRREQARVPWTRTAGTPRGETGLAGEGGPALQDRLLPYDLDIIGRRLRRWQ
ncbi:hypothetical protein GCM10009664_41300 [Kitasatospora gansuensis]